MDTNPRVMVVDDDPAARETLAELLRIWGWQAETAADGLEAMEKIRSYHPVAVISDLYMPRMGGIEFLRALRKTFPNVACIIVTGEEYAGNAYWAWRLGAFDYLEKPIDPLRVLVDLRKCLERSGVHD